MQNKRPSHCATAFYATAALLAGCGGSQPPVGAPGTMPLGWDVSNDSRSRES